MSEGTGRANPKPPSVDRLSLLWRRINDHKMVQWSVAYVALAYGVQHGVELTSDAFDWPHTVMRVSMLLLVLGLPLVMTLAWYHGERASRQFSTAELTIVSMLLVIGTLLFYAFVRPSEEVSAGAKSAVRQASAAAARAASASVGDAISIAVLPFLNLSRDPDQEFFSDGMTEEITSALAKVPNLRVVARTSAFEFKGQNRDISAIAQALHATHLIEGSVRRDGNKVRITAQLIKADDGTHLWTESYDRELMGVFAVQEEIAQAIAAALRVPLGLRQSEALVRNHTRDDAAYENYLRAKALVRSRIGGAKGFTQLTEAAKLLEQVVAREPDFAPAWALLAVDYALTPAFRPAYLSGNLELMRSITDTVIPKAEAAARRAIELDPKNPDGYIALGSVQAGRAQLLRADELYAQGLALDPGNPDGLHQYSTMLGDLGYMKKAVPVRERLQGLEPLVPVFQLVDSRILFASGDNDAALAALKLPNLPQTYATLYAAEGRYGEAADALLMIPAGFYLPGLVEAAARLLRTAPAPAATPQTLPRLGFLEFAYVYVGATNRVLDYYEDMLEIGWRGPSLTTMLWAPPYASVRRTERFKAFVRKAGLVDYWKQKGWPDLCRPVGSDDFACD